jgi:hypothetical protein
MRDVRDTHVEFQGRSRRLVLATCAVVLAGCSSAATSSTPMASASPAPSSVPTLAPAVESAEPTPATSAAVTFGPPPAPAIATAPPRPSNIDLTTIRPGMIVRVEVDHLRLREWPDAGSTIVATLNRGDLVELRYDVLDAGGYRWIAARPFGGAKVPALPAGPGDAPPGPDPGWIAVAKGDVMYVKPEPIRCPDVVDLAQLSGMVPAEQLGCFGKATLVVQGTWGCPGCGGSSPYQADPPWLAGPFDDAYLSVDITSRFGPFFLNFPPPLPDIPFLSSENGIDAAPILRVVGHFDDARSADCRISGPRGFRVEDSPLVAYDPKIAQLICRQRFVVDSFERVGWDPNFHGG